MSSTGVPDLDAFLAGGLHDGDNVVWLGDDRAVLGRFAQAFLSARGEAAAHLVVTSGRPVLPAGVDLVDARARRPLAEPVALERALVDRAGTPGVRIVVDGLDHLALRWGRDRALGFFSRTCPRLFDAGAIAYWTGSRGVLGNRTVESAQRVTQCVFECSRGRLRIVKAEGRPARVQGAIVTLHVDDELRLGKEQALGRVAEGLQRIRSERRLGQADLARLAGVSPSAISQALAGRRGLSLDTLVVLCERLGIGLDDLLGRPPPSRYVLARRERRGTGPVTPLLDDPRAGLRLNLIRLSGGEQGSPSVPHKGAEFILVANGLVLVDLGDATPVLRAGDAVLATRVPVLGWRNLLADPALLFWTLRDETAGSPES